MFKREKLLSKEEYKSNVRTLNKNLDDIYFKLMENKNLNAYDTQCLASRFESVIVEITENIEGISKADEHEYKKYKRKIRTIISILITNIAMIFISFPISVAIGLICFYKMFAYRQDLLATYTDDDIEFAKYLKNISIEVNNCVNLIEYINKNRSERAYDKNNDFETRRFDIANDIINLYLEEEITNWEEIPENIQELVISILQDNLNTPETDIYKLIEIANKRLDIIFDEEISNTDIYTRNLRK